MADSMENLPFHRKYRPNDVAHYIGNERVKVTAMKALEGGKRPQVILLWGDSGCGKAQPLDSLVLTTDGYEKMGNIKVGDEVFTRTGARGKVSGIYPQGVRPIYRITLSDRTYIDVSDEHLNCVWRYNTKTKEREDYVLTTTNLIKFFKDSKYKLRFDVPSVDWDVQDVPLDAYLVGALIGDGCLTSGNFNFSNSEQDILDKVDSILRENYSMCLNYIETGKYDYRISSMWKSKYYFKYKGVVYYGCDAIKNKLQEEGYPLFDSQTVINLGLKTAPVIFSKYPELKGAVDIQINESYNDTYFRDSIKDLGLTCKSIDKFIPDCYLYNDRAIRLELLRGLIDTDGTISKNGQVEFSTSSKRLSDDFAFLVRSLGIRDTISEKETSYTNEDGNRIDCAISYRHFLKIPNDLVFFTSEKHKSRYNKKQHEPIRNIETIEYIGDKECQCIMIDHPDHTYISDFFIPTHNTTFARLLAKEYSCEDRDELTGACNSCVSCQSINEYIATGDTSILTNIQEINIADQSGKRDLDDVLEDMMIPAYGDEWKIYIFDECHEATSALQNKLLKIAEEPPEHVLMLFCTTNPEKVIPTLKNRCQLQLHITKPKVNELAGLLRYVCESEQLDYDRKGLEFIANRAGCTIRTSLQYLQQVVTEQGNAKYDSAINVFEEVSDTIIIGLLKALKSKDTLRYVTFLHQIKCTMDLNTFIPELQNFVTRGIYTINGIDQDGVSDGELKIYRELFGDLGVEEIGYLLTRILNLRPQSIEMDLLMLGYTGISSTSEESTNKSDIAQLLVESLNDECSMEIANANKVLKESDEKTFKRGVENAESVVGDTASLDFILSTMGGTLIE